MTRHAPGKTAKAKQPAKAAVLAPPGAAYSGIHGDIVALLEAARRAAARSVNALMTASYWEIGRRIVEFEQSGKKRAGYGDALLKRLSTDLTARFGRGFGLYNLQQMRLFYLTWPTDRILQTLPEKSSLSGILCVRHTMTTRSMYAKQKDDESREGGCGEDAACPQGTD